MRKEIQVGDLVYARQGCPVCNYRAMAIFKVTLIRLPRNGWYYCPKCKWSGMSNQLGAEGSMAGTALLPLPWLKRIPPLDELEAALSAQGEQYRAGILKAAEMCDQKHGSVHHMMADLIRAHAEGLKGEPMTEDEKITARHAGHP